jgi:ABC-type nitrate/sulfonate/bicarbonate transport system substrate-binding protein
MVMQGRIGTMRARLGKLTVLVASSVLFAACAGAATPVPTTTTAPTAGVTATTDGTLPKPELASIKMGGQIGEIGQFASLLAQRIGIYEKHGLKVDFTVFNDDGAVASSMFSGQVDMSTAGAALIINSRLTDTPAKDLAIQKTKVIDGLFCGSAIKTAADVKGKAIAVSSLGSTAHASALLAVEALKLSDKDVIFQPVGGQSVRLAALKAGSVACAPISMDQAADMQALGFNVVVDLSKSGLEYPSSGVSALDSFLAKNPNTVLVVLASVLEALNYMLTKPDETAQQWASYAQVDAAKALAAVKTLPGSANPTLRWTEQGFVFTQKVMAIVSPGIMTVDVKQAYDDRYLKKLEEIGFYKKIGVAVP